MLASPTARLYLAPERHEPVDQHLRRATREAADKVPGLMTNDLFLSSLSLLSLAYAAYMARICILRQFLLK